MILDSIVSICTEISSPRRRAVGYIQYRAYICSYEWLNKHVGRELGCVWRPRTFFRPSHLARNFRSTRAIFTWPREFAKSFGRCRGTIDDFHGAVSKRRTKFLSSTAPTQKTIRRVQKLCDERSFLQTTPKKEVDCTARTEYLYCTVESGNQLQYKKYKNTERVPH